MTLIILLDEDIPASTPPTVTYDPVGSSLLPSDTFSINISALEGVSSVTIYLDYEDLSTEVVYSGGVFLPAYISGSSLTGPIGAQVYTIDRSPDWTQGFTVRGSVTDTVGNTVLFEHVYTMGTLPGAVIVDGDPEETYPLEQITNYELERELFIEIWKEENAPRLNALMDIVMAQTQELEDALWQLLNIRTIAAATGQYLDDIGAILGLARNGLVDDNYRLHLQAWIVVLRSKGRTENLYAVIRALLPDATTELTASDHYPHTVRVVIHGADGLGPIEPVTMFYYLRNAKGAGIRLLMEWWPEPESDMFTLSSSGAVEIDVNQGFSDTAMLTGGSLAGGLGA